MASLYGTGVQPRGGNPEVLRATLTRRLAALELLVPRLTVCLGEMRVFLSLDMGFHEAANIFTPDDAELVAAFEDSCTLLAGKPTSSRS